MRSGGFAAWLFAMLPIFATLWASALTAAEDYRLQPGDRVRLTIVSLPEFNIEGAVGLEGSVRLPPFGVVPARGRTIDELERDLRGMLPVRPLKRFDADGMPVFLSVDPEDLALDIASFRSVYVSGDVAQPGAVAFTPGLIVRAAIAASGGPRAGGLLRTSGDPLRDEARLQGDFRLQWLEIANLRARLWRIEAELAEDAALPPPTPDALGLPPEVRDEIVAVNADRIRISLAAVKGQRSFLRSAIAQADERLKILQSQASLQAVAVKDDEDELGRVATLYQRGVVPVTRLAEIRRAQLASSTRLLQTEDSRTRLALDRTRFERELSEVEERRESALSIEREETQRRLREAGERLTSIRRQLDVIGSAPVGFATAVVRVEVVLHRDNVERAVDLDEPLAPGDVIEISVIDPAAGALN